MIKKILFLRYWMPVILWASMIFYASAQPYEEQDLRPTLSSHFQLGWVELVFSDVSFTYAGSLVSIETRGVEGFVEFFIRKIAHLSVYFVLGFLLYRLVRMFVRENNKKITYAIVTVIFYAATDEIHQAFVPTRSGMIEDVILDSVGGVLGVFLAFFYYRKR